MRNFILFLLEYSSFTVCQFLLYSIGEYEKKIFFSFLWLDLQHMEVPGLGVKLELQLPAYATATAMQDLHVHS